MKKMPGAVLALLLMAQAPARVDELAWLAGRWETAGDGGRWTEEMWSAPRGGLMLGASRSGQSGAVREFEFLRLQAGEDGVLVYLAQPGGRAPAVPFRLTQSDSASATFENPAHDFPQRIRYQRSGETLTATISAIDGSNAMRWRYRRR
jgi:hypothetical protein